MLNKKAVLLSTGLGIGLVGFSGLASADEVYTIQQGDTVSSIANKFNTTIDEIEKKNHFEDVNMIYVGEQLTIPTLTVQYKESTPVQVQSVSVQQETTVQQPVQKTEPKQQVAQTPVGELTESEAAAKEWIAQRESGGSYSARNNRYIGRYQLDASYLNGDYSPANQERTVSKYIAERYQGSWVKAKAFWQANGWY